MFGLMKWRKRKQLIKKYERGCRLCYYNPMNFGKKGKCPVTRMLLNNDPEGKHCGVYVLSDTLYGVDIKELN